MADNTVIPAGAGGDTIRDIDRAGIKSQVQVQDFGGAVAEYLVAAQSVTGTAITTSTTTTTLTNVKGCASAVVNFFGTHAGVNVTFEASEDGTNWFAIPIQLISTGAVVVSGATGVLTSNGSFAFACNLAAWAQFRVRATAFTSGSCSVLVHTSTGPFNIPLAVDSGGRLSTKEFGPATGTGSSVTSTTTANTSLLASNTARRAAQIYNESTSTLTVALGFTQSSTAYTVKIPSNGYYEIPAGFTGAITGSWAAANGAARITEMT